jgi:hypothetical protein
LLLKAESMVNAAAFLRGVYRCLQAPDQLRATAAIALLPYENVRWTDRRVSRPLDLPKFDTVELALANIAELKDRVYKGLLGIEEGAALVALEDATIRAIEGTVLERDFRAVERVIEHQAMPVHIVISGGLPVLPLGSNDSPMIMPDTSSPACDPGPWSPPKDDPK